MARRGTKNDLVKCEYCGEMYSVTYKHCPFCNEDGTGRWNEPDDDYYEDEERGGARGGKRLAGGVRRDGPGIGTIIGGVASLALIIAAVCIVISLVKSLTGGGKNPAPTQSAAPAVSAQVSAAPVESEAPTAEPDSSEPPVESATPDPQVTTPSADIIAPTDFKLNREDFTLDHVGEIFQMKATYTPANARGDITWKSSDPNVASVSWNGLVTAVSPGTVTITASVAGVGDKTCIVRCNFASGSTTTTTTTTTAPATSSTPSASGVKLNREDFTLSSVGETWRLTVSGSSSAVTWSSSKPEVATVSGDGTVTAVSKGTATVSATVDGVTLKCIVRCNF